MKLFAKLAIPAFVSVVLTGTVFAEQPAPVTICHATESATNPWNQLWVNENALNGHFENNGTPKSGHEKDLLFQGHVTCPSTPQVPEFGLLTGIVALMTSGGSYFLLRKRLV